MLQIKTNLRSYKFFAIQINMKLKIKETFLNDLLSNK